MIRAIDQMVSFLEARYNDPWRTIPGRAATAEALAEARRLALEEANEKPTANADLVWELEELMRWWKEDVLEGLKWEYKDTWAGRMIFDHVQQMIRNRPVPVVKGQGEARLRLASCPTCGDEIKSTERRPDGDSVCVNGHKHKTKEFFIYRPSAPAPVASGLVEAKDNIEKAMKGITERQTQEDSYWRGYYNCLEETWDSLNVQISRYSKEAK